MHTHTHKYVRSSSPLRLIYSQSFKQFAQSVLHYCCLFSRCVWRYQTQCCITWSHTHLTISLPSLHFLFPYFTQSLLLISLATDSTTSSCFSCSLLLFSILYHFMYSGWKRGWSQHTLFVLVSARLLLIVSIDIADLYFSVLRHHLVKFYVTSRDYHYIADSFDINFSATCCHKPKNVLVLLFYPLIF